MLNEFVNNFTDKKIEYYKLGDRFYKKNNLLIELMQKISNKPYSISLFLGEIRNRRFFPSIALIDEISFLSDKKVYLNEKAEWLFICGRDVFNSGVVRSNAKTGLVLVQNENDENLGYGEIVSELNATKNKKAVFVKNLLDKGKYLRMER